MTPESVEVTAPAGIVRAELVDPAGVVLLPQRPPSPVQTLELRARLVAPGTYQVRLQTADGQRHTLPVEIDAPPAPLRLMVDAPVGQGARAVSDGDRIAMTVIAGRSAQASIRLEALSAGPAQILVDDAERRARPGVKAGERLVVLTDISAETTVTARLGAAAVSAVIVPEPITVAQAQAALQLTAVTFPATQDGVADATRPRGRVNLPAAWWRAVLRALGLGFRPQSGDAPWSWQGVTLKNHSDTDINVVISARVLSEDGAPAPAFSPRMRAGSDGTGRVSALLRIPAAASARAALPLYVDANQLSADAAAEARWRQELTVTPIGASEPLLVETRPLYVSHGSTVASAGLLLALLASAAGTGLLLARAPRWLRTHATSELMTIALFGAMSFLASAAGRVLSMGAAALLGPFAILLTGLIDDVLRYALWATLLTLLPRPGVASLTLLTHWLLTGIALGDFSPTDVLFIGGRVFWLEGALWVFGITRSSRWRQQPRAGRWLRLTAAFGFASVATSATGLVLHVVLYRLFLADWYVAMVLIGPGFLYVAFACWLATPFAESLRKIQR